MMKRISLTILCLFLFGADMLFAQANVLVAYHSETGNTLQMAQAVAEGADNISGVDVILLSIDDVTHKHLLQADAIIVGSPVHNANVSAGVQEFISSWPFEGKPLKNKVGAAFVTAGGISAGEETAQLNILKSMLVFGMIVTGGPDWTQPFGASAVTAESPFEAEEPHSISDMFLEKGKALGKRVAKLALRLQ